MILHLCDYIINVCLSPTLDWLWSFEDRGPCCCSSLSWMCLTQCLKHRTFLGSTCGMNKEMSEISTILKWIHTWNYCSINILPSSITFMKMNFHSCFLLLQLQSAASKLYSKHFQVILGRGSPYWGVSGQADLWKHQGHLSEVLKLKRKRGDHAWQQEWEAP